MENGTRRGYLPDDPSYEGVFVVIVRRAPGNVWDVEHTADGRIRRIKRRVPRPWVNHYAFHIMDRDWGHLIIRFCPHPPFNASWPLRITIVTLPFWQTALVSGCEALVELTRMRAKTPAD